MLLLWRACKGQKKSHVMTLFCSGVMAPKDLILTAQAFLAHLRRRTYPEGFITPALLSPDPNYMTPFQEPSCQTRASFEHLT